jgi:hypothetical protein
MKDLSPPSKIKKDRDLLHLHRDEPIKWKDIKHFQFEDDDVIHIGFDEGYVSENESWDAHYFAIITRKIEETDKEFEERMEMSKMLQENLRKKRYETYLRLKAEFEQQ